MFKKVFIANRGEIAVRILNTLQRMHIGSVLIYTEQEKNAEYLALADETYCLGDGELSETYLNISKIIQLAVDCNSDAIHPGYGFLSENPKFAEACAEAGITFIGPKPATMIAMGNKLNAVKLAKNAGIPVIPHLYGGREEIIQGLTNDFFPCLIKATAGGGGKAMHIARTQDEIPEMLSKSSREAEKYFAHSEVFVEKYFSNPRHIEVQILGDAQGNVAHLFERECSLQRRYQKIVEEAPSASVDSVLREKLVRDALILAKQTDYEGVGTVEFLVDTKGNHYFLEMNTRIQVEHAVTEMITGVDLVEEQLQIAFGSPVSEKVKKARINGHAIEARIYAEDPDNDFRPSPGKVNLIHFPQHTNLRIDTALISGSEIHSSFDPMIAKISVWAATRDDSIEFLTDSLKKTVIHGTHNNTGFLVNLIRSEGFRKNAISTHFVSENLVELIRVKNTTPEYEFILVAAGLYLSLFYLNPSEMPIFTNSLPGYWRIHHSIQVRLGSSDFAVKIQDQKSAHFSFECNGQKFLLVPDKLDTNVFEFGLNGKTHSLYFSRPQKGPAFQLSLDERVHDFYRKDFLNPSDIFRKATGESTVEYATEVLSPLNGKVIEIRYKVGEQVLKGEGFLVIESMKMENEISMPHTCFIKTIRVKTGEQVKEGDLLAELSRS